MCCGKRADKEYTMNPTPFFTKLALKKIAAILFLSVAFVSFQNCSGGFETGSLDASSFSSFGEDPTFLKGQRLYTQNCATCHSGLSTSTKKQRTEEQIRLAITTFPQMQHLSNLTKDDLAVITYALANPNGTTGAAIYQCRDPNSRGSSHNQLRRLSSSELANTLRSLLGDTIYNDSVIQQKLGGLPSDIMKSGPSDFSETPNDRLAGVLLDIGIRVDELFTAQPSLRGPILGTCAVSAITDACVRQAIENFGLRVFRRKLTAAEAEEHFQFYQQMSGGAQGLQLLVVRFLQNPTLVFHFEDAGTTITNGRFRLTDYEIASRISYLTTGTMPDATLFAAAERGELQSLDNVRSQVERLIATPQAKAKVEEFFKYYSKLHSLPVLHQSILNHSQISGNNLSPAIQQEAFDFFNYIFWTRDGNFSELMTSTAAFPKSAALSTILNAPVVNAQNPVSQAASHPGLLHRPALLTNAADRTSPIIRGAHIRQMYLCDELGMAPAEAVAARETELGDINDMPNRNRTALLTEGPACMGCHSQINNLGFPFEKFNPLGQVRALEPVFNQSGALLREFPIDTQVTDPRIESGGPSQLQDSIELVNALARSKKAQACFAKKMFEFYQRKRVDQAADSCLLASSSSAASVRSLKNVLIESVANEDIFWRKDATRD